MRLQRILSFLVFALPVLIVGFAAVMAGSALAEATGDTLGAQVMRRVAAGGAMVLMIDLVLLVGALGVRTVAEDQWRDLRRQRRQIRRQRRDSQRERVGRSEDRHRKD